MEVFCLSFGCFTASTHYWLVMVGEYHYDMQILDQICLLLAYASSKAVT